MICQGLRFVLIHRPPPPPSYHHHHRRRHPHQVAFVHKLADKDKRQEGGLEKNVVSDSQ